MPGHDRHPLTRTSCTGNQNRRAPRGAERLSHSPELYFAVCSDLDQRDGLAPKSLARKLIPGARGIACPWDHWDSAGRRAAYGFDPLALRSPDRSDAREILAARPRAAD